jgi:hypothetical protein
MRCPYVMLCRVSIAGRPVGLVVCSTDLLSHCPFSAEKHPGWTVQVLMTSRIKPLSEAIHSLTSRRLLL